MYIEICGKKGQGDKIEETNLINRVVSCSSLCIVLEEIGFLKNQEDTAIDLTSSFEIFEPFKNFNKIFINEVDANFYNTLISLFSKKGLVVIDIKDSNMRKFFLEKMKDFYFERVKANCLEKINIIYIKYSR